MLRVIVLLIATSLLNCTEAAEWERKRTSRQPVISAGIDPLLGTLDYNVRTHREG